MLTIAADVVAHGGHGMHDGGWWPIFPVFWLLFFGVLFFFAFKSRRNWGPGHHAASAEGILSERYARGEISVEEYRDRLGVLKEKR